MFCNLFFSRYSRNFPEKNSVLKSVLKCFFERNNATIFGKLFLKKFYLNFEYIILKLFFLILFRIISKEIMSKFLEIYSLRNGIENLFFHVFLLIVFNKIINLIELFLIFISYNPSTQYLLIYRNRVS